MGALRSTSPQIVVLPSGCTSNAGTTTYTWWIKGTLRTAPAGVLGHLGTSSTTTSNGFVTNATLQLRVYTAGTNRYGTGDNFFEVGVYHHYRLEHDSGGAWRAYRDNMTTPVASGTFTGSTNFAQLNQMFRSSSTSTMYAEWDLEEMGITSTTFNETYNANLSGGTGNILPTVSGNNQGALNTPLWPSNNSQWVGFGATSAASIAAVMPQFVVAASASVTVPVYSAALSVTMPQMTVAAVASNSAPVYSSSVSFVMPQMQVAANASASVSGNSAAIAFSMPQMVAAIDAASSVPVYSSLVSVTMPQMSVGVVASSALPDGNTVTVGFAMPQFTVAASGSPSAPSISAAISFAMPQMIVQVSTFEAEYFAADNIELADASRHIELASALSHIELASQSAVLELIAASRHLEYTIPSTHLEWRA